LLRLLRVVDSSSKMHCTSILGVHLLFSCVRYFCVCGISVLTLTELNNVKCDCCDVGNIYVI